MKKLLCGLSCLAIFISTPIYAVSTPIVTYNSIPNYGGDWESIAAYESTALPTVNQYQKNIAYPLVTYNGGLYMVNGTSQPAVGVNPTVSSAWDTLVESSGSVSLSLPSGQIFVGNGSDSATPRTMSGAITINSLGVTTPTISTFWITSTGASNNVLTGVQDRYGTVATATILPSTMISVNVVYPSACRTNVLSLTISVLESTSGLDLTSKIISSSLSGFTAEIYNNDVAIPSQVGSLNYQTVCN